MSQEKRPEHEAPQKKTTSKTGGHPSDRSPFRAVARLSAERNAAALKELAKH